MRGVEARGGDETRLLNAEQPGAVAAAEVRTAGLPREPFERLTKLAVRATGAPTCLAVLVDDERQMFLAQEGLGEPWASLGQTPLSHSLCALVAGAGVPLIVSDARSDPRVKDHLAVRDMGVVAYAGMPIYVEDACVGSFCLIDAEPREWTPPQLLMLSDLADSVTAQLELYLAAERVAALASEKDEALEELKVSDERYRSLVAAMVDGVVLQDRSGVIHECNVAAERILGLTADQMMGRTSLDPRWRSIYPDGTDFHGADHPSMRTLETGEAFRDVVMGIHKPSGELTWLSICTEPLLAPDGTPEAVVVTFSDITHRRELEERREHQLVEQHALRSLATLVASNVTPEAVFASAAQHAAHVLGANAGGVARLCGDGRGATLVGAWVPAHLAVPSIGEAVDLDAGTATGTVLKTGRAATRPRPCAYLRRSGVGSSLAAPIIVDGQLWGALSVAYDTAVDGAGTTEQLDRLARFADLVGLGISSAEARDQLARQASIDRLTGLSNQGAFTDALEAEAARAVRHDRPLSLVVIDIDHFKRVNDTLGHATGNDVLAEFAVRLKEASRSGDLVGRVGGEEFAVILPETTRAQAFQVAERMRAAVQAAPFPGAGRITASAGVCELSDAGDAGRLFRHADLALYQAKAEGRNTTFAYSPDTLELLSSDEQARRLKDAGTLAAIRALATAVDAKDPSTQRHSERVAELTAALATEAGWSPADVAELRDAALVHDIGKIAIPDTTLLKPGKLTDAEYAQIKTHSAIGAEMVDGVLSRRQTDWIRHHHERYDGRGYPDQIAGEAISEGARLMALADSWDAMTVARPYGTPRTHEEAINEIQRAAGTQFCPTAVRHFLALAGTVGDVSTP